tara:strand:+ start:58 stop:324 length:267 start_codon:yes stop_codon:yes gene_type:complete
MSSSLPLDLELESFGWSENLITINSIETYSFIVDKTITMAIFLIIYIYCLLELILELAIKDFKVNIFIPQLNLFNFRDLFLFPRLLTK